MKKIYLSLIGLIGLLYAQNVGIGTATPDASAKLDVVSTSGGILIPRVDIQSATDATTIPSPATGLMVWNTGATFGTAGFYFNSGTTVSPTWVRVLDSSSSLNDADADPNNEIQDLSLSGNTLSLSGDATTVNLAPYLDNTDDQKIDVFSLSGNNLQLSLESDGEATKTVDLSGFKDHNFYEIGQTRGADNINDNIFTNGRVQLNGTADASGTAGSGVLEIANTLRLDGNEIITNTNTPLYIQNDNGGDLIVDGSTLVVDASADRVGIGTTTPGEKLQVVNGDILMTSGYAIELQATDKNIELDDANPTWLGEAYGGVTRFYGDGALERSKLEAGALQLERRLQIKGGTPGVDKVLRSDATGNASWVDIKTTGIGDDLGNHVADQHLNMNDFELRNVKAIQGKDWDDNTGGTDNKYRLLFRDGAHQFYNGGVVVGSYGNGTWTDLADGRLIVKDRIGVGTTSPVNQLHVEGSTYIPNGASYWIGNYTDAGDRLRLHHSSTSGYIDYATGSLFFRSGTTTRFTLTNAGRFGIGTTAPTESIHTNSGARVTTGIVVGAHDSYGNHLLTLSSTTPAMKIGNSGAYNAVESGRIIFEESVSTNENQGTSCGIQMHYDGNANRLDFDAGCTSSSTYMSFTRSGRLGIATTAPTALLSVNGAANKTGGGTWATFSDRRLKHNITDYNEGLDLIMKVRPVNFAYNKKMVEVWGENVDTEKVYQGVIAQELQEVAPDMVRKVTIAENNNSKDADYIERSENETFLEVDPNKFTYALINAVQEQQKQIEELKILNQQQQKQIEELRELIKE